MASSANKPEPPTPTNTATKWAKLVRSTDHKKTSFLSPETTSLTSQKRTKGNPFLKGTIPQSVFVDISNVKDQKTRPQLGNP